MQFKHPEILYVLFALLIPVIVHLFQLQRFTKVFFTNVKFLKQVELQTRKSSQLKKWLVLFVRIFAFASLIIAFAQPYFSKNDTSKSWNTTIYIDNSYSMQAKGPQGELFKRAIQDVATNIPNKGFYTLLTNDETTTNLTKDLLIEHLKDIDYSPTKSDIKTVLLQAKQRGKDKDELHQKLLLFSDFQQDEMDLSLFEKEKFDFVALEPVRKNNVAVDSCYVTDTSAEARSIEVVVKNRGEAIDNLVVKAMSNQLLLAKSMLPISANSTKKITLRIPIEYTNIRVQLENEDRFTFDNFYQVSFTEFKNTNVLLVGHKSSFLDRIYTEDEFSFIQYKANQLPYEKIDQQDLIVVNNLATLSSSLQSKIASFVSEGGSLVIIPNRELKINTINSFFKQLHIGEVMAIVEDSLKVTQIHYAHPILKNVFDKKVQNFQYPSVNQYFKTALPQEKPILSFENKQPFISQIAKKSGNIFWVASPLDKQTGNFTNAPLIVPVFYNIAKQSTVQDALSYRIGQNNEIAIHYTIDKDAVLHVVNDESDFIPIQQLKSDEVRLSFDDLPNKAGFYKVMYKEEKIQDIAFNTPKIESNLNFIDMSMVADKYDGVQTYSTIKDAFSDLQSQQQINSYFKWFILLALLFLLIEMLLLKYL